MEHEQTKTNVKNNEVDEHPVNSKNVPAQMLDFHQNQRCTLFPSLCSSPLVLSFFHFCLPWNLLKCFPPLWFVRRRRMSLFCLSLPLSPTHSLSLSLSSSLIRYTDSPFNGRHLVQSALSCFLASRSISDHSSLIKYSCNINSHEYLPLGVQRKRQIYANMSSSEGTVHWQSRETPRGSKKL